MRINRRTAVLIAVLTTAAVTIPATYMATEHDVHASSGHSTVIMMPAPTNTDTSVDDHQSMTEAGSRAINTALGPACHIVEDDTVNAVMGVTDPNRLKRIDTDKLSDGGQCLRRADDGSMLVSIHYYTQSLDTFQAAFKDTVDQYAAHQGESYYRNTMIKQWPAGPTHAMPLAKDAYTTITAKYRHHKIFVNDGTFTVVVWIYPVSQDSQQFTLAEKALEGLKSFE